MLVELCFALTKLSAKILLASRNACLLSISVGCGNFVCCHKSIFLEEIDRINFKILSCDSSVLGSDVSQDNVKRK